MNVKITIAILIYVTRPNSGAKGATKLLCDTSVSDFKKLIESGAFIDKSLLIKTIFEKESVILITAPRHFGKSTNLNMLKRFLEINVNAKGEQMDVVKTKNFKLFVKKKLKIYSHKNFFNQHFGKHPVIFIDYKQLSETNSYNSLLESFKIIIRKTFLQHEYLIYIEKLWTGSLSVNKFKKYIDPELNEKLTPLDIKQGFTYLSEILYKLFRKQVFVLIDDYDAYLDSLIFKNNPDMESILTFIQGVNNDLLKSNEYLNRAVLTGILRVTGAGLSAPGHNIKEYSFLHNHPFASFYGMTECEVDEFLNIVIQNVTEIEETKRTITRYYSGYSIIKQPTKLYSLWSVINFLGNNKEPVSYWCRPEYVQNFLPIFSLEEIKTKLEDLLSGKNMVLDITTPLSKHDILMLNNILETSNANQQQVLSFFYLLFELGYLSVQKGNIEDQNSIHVEMPNLEIKLEFGHMLRHVYVKQYDISLNNINALNNLMNSVGTGNAKHHNLFTDIYKGVNRLFSQSRYQPKNENSFRSVLFVCLMAKFPSVQSDVYNPTPPGFIDILFRNDHGVTFIIKIKMSLSVIKTYRDQIAMNSHKEIILKGFINYLDTRCRNKVVYLGMSFSLDRNVSIGYSYFLNDGDNLGNTKILF